MQQYTCTTQYTNNSTLDTFIYSNKYTSLDNKNFIAFYNKNFTKRFYLFFYQKKKVIFKIRIAFAKRRVLFFYPVI